MYSFGIISYKYGYGRPENSTKVITIKKVNYLTSKILHSRDFAIINIIMAKNTGKTAHICTYLKPMKLGIDI